MKELEKKVNSLKSLLNNKNPQTSDICNAILDLSVEEFREFIDKNLPKENIEAKLRKLIA